MCERRDHQLLVDYYFARSNNMFVTSLFPKVNMFFIQRLAIYTDLIETIKRKTKPASQISRSRSLGSGFVEVEFSKDVKSGDEADETEAHDQNNCR